jgi:hypothetical protein
MPELNSCIIMNDLAETDAKRVVLREKTHGASRSSKRMWRL